MNYDDLLAYLSVLGYHAGHVKEELICGCLLRVEAQLEKLAWSNKEYRVLLHFLQFRERLNGYLDHEHPMLAFTTVKLRNMLLAELTKLPVTT